MKRKVSLGAVVLLLLFVALVLAINRPQNNTPTVGLPQQAASLGVANEPAPASDATPAASAGTTDSSVPPKQKVDTSQLNDVDASLNDDLDNEVNSSL